MRNNKKKDPKKIKPIYILVTIFLVVVIFIFLGKKYWNTDEQFLNTEYKYSIDYPKGGNVSFISSMNGNTSPTTADTVGLQVAGQNPIRIQVSNKVIDTDSGESVVVGNNKFHYHGAESLCSYTISGPSSSLCLLVKQNPEELKKNIVIFNVLKSIKMY